MEVDSEYSESSTTTFEWSLKGLKNLFDSTKGDKKSKVTKSIHFGNNRWQILFYANAGQTKDGVEGGGYVSLYLSCEPTAEEKEASLAESGRWVRDGIYKFSFELRSVGKPTILYNSKEANNHTFTYKTANWGWAQFARRDSVYYDSQSVKSQDAFVIICTITSSPSKPPPWTLPRQPVPKNLLDTVGGLLDDPTYSDVQFVIPRRGQSLSNGRKIWASKRLLQRTEYFQTMFGSNFAEGSSEAADLPETPRKVFQEINASPPHLNLILDEFEDSDNEYDDDEPSGHLSSSIGSVDFSMLLPDSNLEDSDRLEAEGLQTTDSRGCPASPPVQPSPVLVNLRQGESPSISSKMSIVVRDAAYTTYLALLYYIYTDNIVFAPLSSSFLAASHETRVTPTESIPSTPSEGSLISGTRRFVPREHSSSRAEWIREWMTNNPGRPAPCSAKSVYRIADRLHLPELKERAAQHIMKSLTVENIGYEIFSPFSSAFEAIRKLEVDFFLTHWQEIRASETMKNVWLQIRNGRHPGFEEVWPLIAQSLEFKPSTSGVSSATKTVEFTG